MVITSGVRDKVRQGMLFSSNCVYRNKIMFLLVYPHLLFYIPCIVLHNFFGHIWISILMSGAFRLHLRYCGGDVGHIKLHGVGSFLVGLSV